MRRALAVMLLLVMLVRVVLAMANKPKVVEQKPVKTICFAKLKPVKKFIPAKEDWKFVKDVMYTDFHILIG